MSASPRIIRYYNLPLVMVSIVGKMGSGKTNWGYHILHELREVYLAKQRKPRNKLVSYITPVYFPFDWSHVNNFWDFIEGRNGYEGVRFYRRVFVFIDDVSFAMHHASTRTREFLQSLARIRHRRPSVRRWYVAVAFHYSRATLPFLRQSQVIIATSCSTYGEEQGLKEFFNPSAVKRYHKIYLSDADKFPALVNSWGHISIMRIPFYNYKRWGNVIGANGVRNRQYKTEDDGYRG